jgi:hypothetical protein
MRHGHGGGENRNPAKAAFHRLPQSGHIAITMR